MAEREGAVRWSAASPILAHPWGSPVSPLSEQDLDALRSWIGQATGVRGEDYRSTFLERRLTPRLRATGCPDAASYLAYLEEHRGEARTLAQKLLVPTTEIFRNPEVFAVLRSALRERAGLPGWAPLRAMSAPCSTGEEAVSLAILFCEMGLDGRILAGDRSRRALHGLRRGRFAAKSLAKLDNRLRERYFREEVAEARVVPAVADRILPLCCDLTRGFPGRGLHVFLLRNLFIYLTEEAQERLLRQAVQALVPGGLLVLGRAESIGRKRPEGLAAVDAGCKVYAKAWGGA